MELPPRKVLPFPFYLRVLGLSAAIGLPVWLSRHYWIGEESTLLGLGWSIPLYLLLFALLGTLTNTITADDWKKFREWASLKFLWS